MRKNLTVIGIILALIAIIALAIAKTMTVKEGFVGFGVETVETKAKAIGIADLVNRG